MSTANDAKNPYGDFARPEMHRFVPPGTQRLLDVGCNLGAFGHALKQRGVAEVWGVEMVEAAAQQAATRLDRVLLGSFESVELPDAYFDAISFNDVLEHMVEPAAALRLAVRKLRLGGVVIASIPNLRNFDNLVHIVLDRDFRYESAGIRDRTHLRFFTLKSIPALYEGTGLHITRIEGINENWWQPSWRRRLAFRLFAKQLADTRYLQYAVVATPQG